MYQSGVEARLALHWRTTDRSAPARRTMLANSGSPATETGASAAAGGRAAARAILGSVSSRETARATPQDMANLI